MFTWMIAEDEQDIHDVLLSMFELWGVGGESFVDGGKAIQWIDEVDGGKVERRPQLAILDIRLPSQSGINVSIRLRQSHVLNDIPIVLTTAYKLTAQEEAAAMAQSGADILIYKPLPHIHELQKLLDEVIHKRAALSKG